MDGASQNTQSGDPQPRSVSPIPSCVSVKSDWSMDHPLGFKDGNPSSAHSPISDSPGPSCVSVKSDWSMDHPLGFKDGNPSSAHIPISDSSAPSCVSVKSDWSMDHPLGFKDGTPSSAHSPISSGPSCVSVKSDWSKDGNLSSAHRFDVISAGTEPFEKLKLSLKQKFQHLNDVITNQKNPTLLNEVYTELYITEGDNTNVNHEHEMRQIETAFRRAETEETPIKCNDIFKPLSEQDKPIRTVLTKGIAGIGKTVSVQKFILDWADGKANQDIQLIFPLPFRELNLMKDQKLSLMELLQTCFKETEEIDISRSCKVLFIFDGLDECRLRLDFQNSDSFSDLAKSSSVEVVLMNLIKGNLLPSALIWITSRPAAANQIPSGCVDRVTEVRGFNDPQKEEYFRKRIGDPSFADRIFTHLKSCISLYIMCHIPVFCWISASVLGRMLGEAEGRGIPKTLTQMYTHFLSVQINVIREKYSGRKDNKEIILKLGQLAFQQLMKGNLIFYEEDLRECGIDVKEASWYSGVCTQIFREETGVYQSKVYCFVHLTIQEYLAALYVHLSYRYQNINVLYKQLSKTTIFKVHKCAVDQALQSENGHLDLFLRFLMGLLLESNQNLLQHLLKETESSFNSKWETAQEVHQEDDEIEFIENVKKMFLKILSAENSISYDLDEWNDTLLNVEMQEYLTFKNLHTPPSRRCHYHRWITVEYIKKTIRENSSVEKSINLFHCLNELGDHLLVNIIQRYIADENLEKYKFSQSQWAALVFVLVTSTEKHDVFDLRKYISRKETSNSSRQSTANVVLQYLKPVVSISRTAQLQSCNITDKGCATLASVLKSKPSDLREVDLSENNIGDSGVKQLSSGLQSFYCKLETLRFKQCNISDKGCADLALALISNPTRLRELDLTGNNLGNSGVKSLSSVLENVHCKLELLRLQSCKFTGEGCAALASALILNPSYLRELDLSMNNIGDSGVILLSAVLRSIHCKLKILRLWDCYLTDEGCVDLALALSSNHSHLRELDLSGNKLGDLVVNILSTALEDPLCVLEILKLHRCHVTNECCIDLASALISNPTHLRELDLTENKLGDSGVKLLSDVLKNPQCKLETLSLRYCDITGEGCADLGSALSSSPSHLRELDLSMNNLGDSGVKRLSSGLGNSYCTLEILRLRYCGITREGWGDLASALILNALYLNNSGDSGEKHFCSLLEIHHNKLETLSLCNCIFRGESYTDLVSTLSAKSLHLRELDLTGNNLEDSEVLQFSNLLRNPHCKLKILR